MKKPFLVFAGVFLAVAAFSAEKALAPRIDGDKIRDHVKYLSSNELEGRGMNQKGSDLAADYIAAQFKSYELKPAGENGTYFQDVPMVSVKTLPDTNFSFVPSTGAPVPLKLNDDYVTNNEAQTESADIDAPIVFVGYGITAPEYQWNDYKNYDLKGKVALLFVSEPVSDDPKFFKGKALTYYGRWTYKFEETARHGAVATLIIHRTDLASYGWEVVRNSWGSGKSYLKLDGTPKLQAASWINIDIAKKLAALGGMDLDKLYQQAQSRDFKPIELPVHLKAHVASEVKPFTSRNVLAMVEGSDVNKKRAEAILYTAHYDHFGIDKNLPGNNIYHGAVDNATGCGILLELARAWSGTKPAPPRSILFAAVTAEEQGLLGSEYLGKHTAQLPVEPILDLNYDALAPIGEPEEVEVSGAERTTFYPTVEQIAKKYGLAIRPDAHPEAGHYYRSDHFSLGRVGIPAFSISEGQKFKGHDAAWGEAQAKDYVDNRYHKPADEFRQDWDFSGLARMAKFGYALGRAAATQPGPINWLPGDEFESAQKKLHAGLIDGNVLFAGQDLRPMQLAAIPYPLLASRTRISGSVIASVSVANDGHVERVDITRGHPLFRHPVENAIKEWKFESWSGSRRTFELKCEFILPEDMLRDQFYVEQPLHLVIAAPPVPINPEYSSVALSEAKLQP
jgi:Zn-dependent M28 family amino/carboxypeptidase